MMNLIYLIIFLIFHVFMSLITEFIGESKGYKGCWHWGFFLGIIGIIVVACCPYKNATSVVTSSKYDELEKLQKLKESGALSQEEFEKEKNKLLN